MTRKNYNHAIKRDSNFALHETALHGPILVVSVSIHLHGHQSLSRGIESHVLSQL